MLNQLPVFIAWIAGIILALVYWKRRPKVSLVALMAFIGFIFLRIIASVYSALFLIIMSKYKSSMMMYNAVFNIVISLLIRVKYGFFSIIFGGCVWLAQNQG
jgi:hypothetical protein